MGDLITRSNRIKEEKKQKKQNRKKAKENNNFKKPLPPNLSAQSDMSAPHICPDSAVTETGVSMVEEKMEQEFFTAQCHATSPSEGSATESEYKTVDVSIDLSTSSCTVMSLNDYMTELATGVGCSLLDAADASGAEDDQDMSFIHVSDDTSLVLKHSTVHIHHSPSVLSGIQTPPSKKRSAESQNVSEKEQEFSEPDVEAETCQDILNYRKVEFFEHIGLSPCPGLNTAQKLTASPVVADEVTASLNQPELNSDDTVHMHHSQLKSGDTVDMHHSPLLTADSVTNEQDVMITVQQTLTTSPVVSDLVTASLNQPELKCDDPVEITVQDTLTASAVVSDVVTASLNQPELNCDDPVEMTVQETLTTSPVLPVVTSDTMPNEQDVPPIQPTDVVAEQPVSLSRASMLSVDEVYSTSSEEEEESTARSSSCYSPIAVKYNLEESSPSPYTTLSSSSSSEQEDDDSETDVE